MLRSAVTLLFSQGLSVTFLSAVAFRCDNSLIIGRKKLMITVSKCHLLTGTK